MVNAQEWLDKKYPKEKRSEVTVLNIRQQNLEGSLDLSDFISLESLDCSNNRLTSLNLSNCFQLEKVYCYDNLLINLTLSTNPVNLKELFLSNNNFPSQDLSFLTGITSLEILLLNNNNQEKIDQGIYNRFAGSLDYLNGMKKLKKLNISNTDLDEVDVDKLPNSLKDIDYSNSCRKNCRLNHIFLKLRGFIENGRCQNCQRSNPSKNWCHSCINQEWQKDFKQLDGQELIKKIIQNQPINNEKDKLKWIPYEEFTDIEYLAEGGFSKIYKTKWERKKMPYENDDYVVLKFLNNCQNITLEFLIEITNTKLVDGDEGLGKIANCYGISQNPQTKEYMIVMEYIKNGDLRQYLKKNAKKLNWESKLKTLRGIASGLKDIHWQNLIHCDFHLGNILIDSNGDSYIADLGLCRPASETDKGKVYGVLPYVAPEVLQGQPYTPASDVYSFGIVAYEILFNSTPYSGLSHNRSLAEKICQGFRSWFGTEMFGVEMPKLFKDITDLITKCLDANVKQRSSINELEETFISWSTKRDAEFTKQIKEVEESIKNLSSNCQTHSQVIYTSRLLDFPNLPQPQNNPSQEWQTTTLLELRVKSLQEQITLFKEPLESELKKLLEQFIETKKNSIKNEQLKSNLWDLEDKLEQKGLSKEKIDELARYCEDLVELEQELEKEIEVKIQKETNNWTNIHPNFTEEQIHSWQSHNFTPQQCKDWLDIGLTPSDYNFCSWLRDTKHLTPEQTLNHHNLEQLNQEFFTYWQEQQQAQIEQLPK